MSADRAPAKPFAGMSIVAPRPGFREPSIPLDPDASEFTKLQWSIAVIEARFERELGIQVMQYAPNGIVEQGRFTFRMPGSGKSSLSFREAWVYLWGIEDGLRLAGMQDTGMKWDADQ